MIFCLIFLVRYFECGFFLSGFGFFQNKKNSNTFINTSSVVLNQNITHNCTELYYCYMSICDFISLQDFIRHYLLPSELNYDAITQRVQEINSFLHPWVSYINEYQHSCGYSSLNNMVERLHFALKIVKRKDLIHSIFPAKNVVIVDKNTLFVFCSRIIEESKSRTNVSVDENEPGNLIHHHQNQTAAVVTDDTRYQWELHYLCLDNRNHNELYDINRLNFVFLAAQLDHLLQMPKNQRVYRIQNLQIFEHDKLNLMQCWNKLETDSKHAILIQCTKLIYTPHIPDENCLVFIDNNGYVCTSQVALETKNSKHLLKMGLNQTVAAIIHDFSQLQKEFQEQNLKQVDRLIISQNKYPLFVVSRKTSKMASHDISLFLDLIDVYHHVLKLCDVEKRKKRFFRSLLLATCAISCFALSWWSANKSQAYGTTQRKGLK